MRLNPVGLTLTVIAILIPIIWLPALDHGRDALALFSQYMGMAALIAMAIVQLIATRWKIVEWIFGGLDQGYVLHKWLGITAMGFILLHDTIDAEMNHLGRQNFLEELAETLGELSLYGLLILVVITLATFIPYHLWRWTHRLMGFFFVAGAAHYLFILKPFKNSDPLALYVSGFCVLGIICFSYRLLPAGIRPGRAYVVQSVEKTGTSLSVVMEPKRRKLRHRAGQFAFASFEGSEPHPFTISKAPDDSGSIRMTVARLGDYTARLHQNLAPGAKVRLEGPFGHFERKRSKKPELWIAAGIGVTPFVAWAQAMDERNGPATLVYCVRNEEDAAHLDELRALAEAKPNFTLLLHTSSSMGRASAESILAATGLETADLTVAFCGPKPMRQALIEDFRRLGVTGRRFKFEEFEIRTGVGLRKIAAVLLDRVSLPERVKEALPK
jgi:predicted ferric reductase